MRELRNVIERLMIMVQGDTITAQDLGFLGRDGVPDGRRPAHGPGPLRRCPRRATSSRRTTSCKTLAAQQGNMSRTAEVLGVERSNLYKKLRAFGVTPRSEKNVDYSASFFSRIWFAREPFQPQEVLGRLRERGRRHQADDFALEHLHAVAFGLALHQVEHADRSASSRSW